MNWRLLCGRTCRNPSDIRIPERMNTSILDYIGNTPLIEIKHLNPNPKVTILAKLEYFNPGGSVKDRPALYMIKDGEASGLLTPQKTVIEATSGNTGIGLALVCSIKGYRLLLAMSDAVSIERQKILKARGADIMLTPGHLGTDGAIEEAYRLARENPDDYFITDQYNNAANWKAHYHTTAEEIWRQTNGSVSMLVATMGTTGTLMGISRKLKEYDPTIRVIGVEPYLGHKIQGLKNLKEAYCPEIFEKTRLDEKINVEDEAAFEMTRQLARKEGLFVGMSSGAAMEIAYQKAKTLPGGTIVIIFPDSGERYLSTNLFSIREKVSLTLFNTMSRSKEPLETIIPGKVGVYSCGPTAYSRLHIDECRRFVFSDLLCRYLEYRGYDVKHVMNITDIDDKTILGSEKANMELHEFTEMHIASFKKDLEVLNIKPATHYPKVSENVSEMVQLTARLIQKGFAYEKLRSIYFDISQFGDYGKLTNIDINKIKLGATVDLDEYEKDNPRDFTLLKRIKLSELRRGIYIKTEWGNMRPSWHIQCAAMSMKYLGDHFDIHTSSRELAFPHHENEIAIAQAATGKTLAKYWVHCDRVLVDGKKVNEKTAPITLEHLLAMGYDGRHIRFWLLASHYRRPITYSAERLKTATSALDRLDRCVLALHAIKNGTSHPEIDQLIYDIKQEFITAMDDDLNISAALAALFKNVKRINILVSQDQLSTTDAQKILDALRKIDSVLHIFDFKAIEYDTLVKTLIEQRETARKEKKWDVADRIRDQLIEKGVYVHDKKLSPGR